MSELGSAENRNPERILKHQNIQRGNIYVAPQFGVTHGWHMIAMDCIFTFVLKLVCQNLHCANS